MNDNKQDWENRSLKYGSSLQSVLFKNMPEAINQHIHNFHERVIKDNITKKESRILDVGCGYGRITNEIIKNDERARIVGLDISENYIEMYIQNTKCEGVVLELENIDQLVGEFDYIMCVTTLMYVEKDKLEEVFNRMLSKLTNEGTIILIEPQSPGVLRRFISIVKNTYSKILYNDNIVTKENYLKLFEVEKVINDCNASLQSLYRIPVTTLLIVPLAAVAKIINKNSMLKILKSVTKLDKKFSMHKLPSLHTAYIVRKSVGKDEIY